MSASLPWLRRLKNSFIELARLFYRRIRERGQKFLCVGILANLAGVFFSFLLYKGLVPRLSVALVSMIGGVFHVLITYSSHYFITFGIPGGFFLGLFRVYPTAWVGMLCASLLGQLLIGTLKFNYFPAQFLIFCFCATYSILVSFLFIYRQKSAVAPLPSEPTIETGTAKTHHDNQLVP